MKTMKKTPFFPTASALLLTALLLAVSVPKVLAQPINTAQPNSHEQEQQNQEKIIIEENYDDETEPNTAPDEEASIQIQEQPGQAQKKAEQARDGTLPDQETAQQTQKQTQARAQMLNQHAMRIQKRYTFYYQRLTSISEKIETRLEKLAEEGKDVTQGQERLADALKLLEQAMEKAETAQEGFNNVEPEDYQAQRRIALQARDDALQAQALFMQTLLEMRQAVLAVME